MDANLELVGRMAGAQTRLAVTLDQRPEPVRFASDDRDHQRQTELPGANEGGGCAADTERYRKRILQRARVNSLAGEWGAMLARPVHMRFLADLQKQIEL